MKSAFLKGISKIILVGIPFFLLLIFIIAPKPVQAANVIATGALPGFSYAVGTKLYVVHANPTNLVAVVDTTTRTVTTTISVGTNPFDAVVVGTDLYVFCSNSDNIYIIDTNTNTVTGTITVGDQPISGTLVGTDIYVNNFLGNTVSVVDTTTDTVTDTITVGSRPRYSTLVGTNLYVNNQNGSSVSVINTTTNTVTDTITVGSEPYTSTLVGSHLYVNSHSASTLSIIDTATNTVSDTITSISPSYYSILVGTKLYRPNDLTGNVTVINTTTNTVSSSISVGSGPWIPVLVGTDLYVINQNSYNVSVIDTTSDTVVATISVGAAPEFATLVGSYLYVSNRSAGTLSVINTTTRTLVGLWNLTYTAGSGGTISGTSSQAIDNGADGTAVTAIPNTGYSFTNWSDASTQNPRTDTNVTGDISVTANFTLQTRTLTYTAGTGGTISGTTPQTINYGASGTAVTAVPDSGYHFVDWSDGSFNNPRTDTNVTSNISVTANFKYRFNYEAGANGSISGTTPQFVSAGGSGSAITAIPNYGYAFLNWSDGSTQNPRTDTNASGDIDVTANFIRAYTLQYVVSGVGGTISGSSPQTVNSGGNGTAVTAVPDAGYLFVDWSDGSTQNPRTDTNVLGDIGVYATFIHIYTLTYTAGTGGTISGSSPQTVNSGGSGSAVTAVPNSGWVFYNWSDSSTSNPRTDTGVGADISVTANFRHSLTYVAGANGSLTGTASQTVVDGGSGTAVTAVPATGYLFVNWSDGSTSNPRTDTNVTTNVSVTANFSSYYTFSYSSGGPILNSGLGANSTVSAIAIQSDGKILIGGIFTTYNGTARAGIARLNSNGTLDTSFDPGTGVNTGGITAIAIQSDGKILAGGTTFTTFNGSSRVRIVRLNSDGSVDSTFDPGTGPVGAPATVNAIAIQSDGKIIIGGAFTTYGGTSRPRIARINSDGTLDTSFTPGTGASPLTVNGIALQSDGKMIIVGGFTTYASTSRPRIARITSTGALDTSFTPGTGANLGTVNGIALQSDGKAVIVGSTFTTYNGTSRLRIARVNTDGTLDTSFDPGTGAGATVSAVALQSDGKVVIGGTITTYNGTARVGIARINTNGTLDTSFDPGAGGSAINAISLESSGDAIIGGTFTTYNGITSNRVARAFLASTGHGSITGSVSQNVVAGGSGTAVTAVADTGYHFTSWSDASTSNPRTDTNASAHITVYANFAASALYTLTYTAGAHGSITGSSPQSVYETESGSAVTAVADSGYVFVNWSDASTQNPRTDTNISGNVTVTANFAVAHTVTYTAGSNGSISGTTPQTVADTGSGTAVTAVPDSGYHFVDWSDASTSNPRTDTNVTGDISVTANFAVNPPTTYSLTYVPGTGGTITGDASQTVNEASDGTAVTAVPNAGYTFTDWSDASTANPRTDTNVTNDISVTANFTINTYNLSYSAGAHGSLTGTTSQTVNYGSDGTAITAVPDSGYSFVNWSDASTSNPRTDTNVTGNVTVTANFAVGTHTLTYTAGANGSLLGGTSQVVNEGADGDPVTAVPNSGYLFSSWSDASTTNPRTDTNVTGDISVTASFVVNPASSSSGGGSSSAGLYAGCKDPSALNYNAFSADTPSLCKYATTSTSVPSATTQPKLGGGTLCTPSQILTQNLHAPSRNGRYDKYTKGIVKEAKILQAHMNRLGFASGKEDGIIGPITDGAIKRMQIFLGTKPDGYIGPITRGLINNSCK